MALTVAPSVASLDWRGTIAYIDQNGNEVERARLRGLLGRPRPDAKVIRAIEARQNEDGGFALGLVPGRPSSIDATALVLGWLQDLRLLRSPQAHTAVTYLLAQQRPDGSWDEAPSVIKFGPPPNLTPGDPRVQALCTALGGYWLALLGYRDDYAVVRAAAYLRERQASDGRVLGFLRTTWTATALFRLVDGPGSTAAGRGLGALAEVEAPRWGPGALIAMLDCLAEAGVPPDIPLIQLSLAMLKGLAQPDGSWPSEEGEFYHVEVTLKGLRVLLLYGIASPLSA